MKLRHLYIVILLSLASSLPVYCFAADSKGSGSMLHANYEHPGSAIDLNSFLSKEHDTILFIHSPHCGPCKKVEPKMKKLAKARNDLKIVDLLLDAPSSKGIGWDSDAAKQFDIHAVPYYLIYDSSGKKLASGEDAETKIESWMKAAGIKVD